MFCGVMLLLQIMQICTQICVFEHAYVYLCMHLFAVHVCIHVNASSHLYVRDYAYS